MHTSDVYLILLTLKPRMLQNLGAVSTQLLNYAIRGKPQAEWWNHTLSGYVNKSNNETVEQTSVGLRNHRNCSSSAIQRGMFPSGKSLPLFAVHSDALHYCPGSLYRAANLLLYHVMKTTFACKLW
jgi:hypothetical protein